MSDPVPTRRRRSIPLIVLAIVAGLLLAAFVTVRWLLPVIAGPITAITFDQSAPIPDFDGDTYTIDDPDRVGQFQALLADHGTSPWMPFFPPADGCTGYTSTSVHIDYEGGMAADMRFYGCTEEGDFVDEATRLLKSWKR